jgi:hypothetical protein
MTKTEICACSEDGRSKNYTMGGGISSLYYTLAEFEQRLLDHKRELRRVLSKSNSLESIDKLEVKDIRTKIEDAKAGVDILRKAIEEEEHALSF